MSDPQQTPKATTKAIGAEGASALLGLFPPPLTSDKDVGDNVAAQTQQEQQKPTQPETNKNRNKDYSENSECDNVFYDTPQLTPSVADCSPLERAADEQEGDRRRTVAHSNATPLRQTDGATQLRSLFVNPADEINLQPCPPTDQTPLLGSLDQNFDTATIRTTIATTYLKPTFAPSPTNNTMRQIDENGDSSQTLYEKTVPLMETILHHAKSIVMDFGLPGTWVGGFMSLLYQIVFSLTMGFALSPTNGTPSLMGLFTKMAAGGVVFGSPIFWICIGDIPALYATVDLFAAPFFADIAHKIDATLEADPAVRSLSPEEHNLVFLTSFSFLALCSMLLTGSFVIMASVFKLVNLGSFLPYSVLAGFFAAVSVMTWQLAFKIDSNGYTPGEVLMSGDLLWIGKSFIHHAPSIVIAIVLNHLGHKNPFYVIGIFFASVSSFYFTMLTCGINRDQAVEDGWFWASSDVVYEPLNAPIGFRDWVTPAPFGWIRPIFSYKFIHWDAVMSGAETAIALSFLYLIRCSFHCPALRKSISSLERLEPDVSDRNGEEVFKSSSSTKPKNVASRGRVFSDAVDLESTFRFEKNQFSGAGGVKLVTAKPTSHNLKQIMASYGYGCFICAVLGFLFITPNISLATTMYKLRAEKVAPQLLACVLLLLFYLFDFRVVSYIPKTAFASLLVLASMNNFHIFFVKSYFRTKEKLEWFVVPLIVGLAFVVGLLNAVFMGIAISTFIFVAAFFRSGVVKFIATGAVIRSTIERTPQSALWLDENGPRIQVLVLQNYLFFGNSSSINNYIESMFKKPEEGMDEDLLPPIPRFVIMDLTLVSGLDTTAVDIFSEILFACSRHECKLFVAGASPSLRKTMQLGGFAADNTSSPCQRKLRFFPDLDAAIGKAEDILLSDETFVDQVYDQRSFDSGFLRALEHIDKQHQKSYSRDLAGLEPYMQRFFVEPGEVLYDELDVERGLFFIERGILKVEQNTRDTLTRSGTLSGYSQVHSLNSLKARSTRMSHNPAGMGHSERQFFRVARVGPGWILGTGESLTGNPNTGKYIAGKLKNLKSHTRD